MSSNGPSSPNPPNNHFFLWVLLLAAFGAPPAAYFSFPSFISQHLSEGIPILVSYEVGIVIIAILKRFWQEFQLTRTFVNILRSWTIYPRYTNRYRNHLITTFNDDVRLGLDGPYSKNIQQIFVEPNFVENPSYQAYQELSNPHMPQQNSHPTENNIWQYLALKNDPKSLLILGAAGIGKTTLLTYLAVILADRKKSTELKVSYKLPFFLNLTKLSEEMKRDDVLSLKDAVESTLKEAKWLIKPLPTGWVEYQLKKDCLILLDGLDEVAELNVRQIVIRQIDQYIDQYSKDRFVISSRPLILIQRDNPLEKMTRLGILPFKKEQIIKFIYNWYNAKANDNSLEKAKELIDRLYESRSKHELLRLARSPLLLGLIINIHQAGGTLPEKRIDLYKRILNYYLDKRWRDVSIDKQEQLSIEEKEILLQTLAYKMMESKAREIRLDQAKEILVSPLKDMKLSIRPEHFLESATNTGIWILGQREGRSYKFAHLSFQEYLASVYVRRNPELLISHIDDSWWFETIILYCSQAETDPKPIIQACLREDENRLVKNAEDLALALYDEQEVQKTLKSIKTDSIYERFNQAVILAAEDKDDIDLRHRIANKLLNQRIESLKDDEDWPDEESKPDQSYIKCAEYQLYLDLTESERQPDHWQETLFPKHQAYEAVLGIRLSDAIAFCDWLTSTSGESKAWKYRLPTFAESKNIFVGKEDQGFWSRDGNKYQFVWGKGKASRLNNLNHIILKSFFIKYSDFNPKDKDLSESTTLDLANKISHIAQIFNKSYIIHNDLIDSLSYASNHISRHQSELKAKYEEISKYVNSLKDQINSAARERTQFQNELNRIENLRVQRDENKKRKIEAKKELDEIVEKQNSLLKGKNKLLESIVNLQNIQKKPSQSQYPGSYSIERQTQSRNLRITELAEKKDDKEQQIQNLEVDVKRLKQELQDRETLEIELANNLRDANQKEKNASQRLTKVLAKENDLAKDLDKARNNLAQAKQIQLSFEAFAQEFDDQYRALTFVKSHFESAYNNALSEALTGFLNCDPRLDLGVLLNKDSYAIKNALAQACTSLSKYISELTDQLVNHLRKADTSIIKSEDIAHAEYLANRLNKLISISKEHIMRLANLLDRDCLDNLNKKRSLIRESSLRRIACYASVIMIKYLSYWLPKEIPSAYQYAPWRDIDLIGRYSDIFIAFAVLEERINGNIPANEAILIVRESVSTQSGSRVEQRGQQ